MDALKIPSPPHQSLQGKGRLFLLPVKLVPGKKNCLHLGIDGVAIETC